MDGFLSPRISRRVAAEEGPGLEAHGAVSEACISQALWRDVPRTLVSDSPWVFYPLHPTGFEYW